MLKYWFVTKNSLSEYLAYRLNFILWRVRVVVSILITYFLWQAIYTGRENIFSYSKGEMFTYIVLLTLINGIVLSTQTFRVAEEINTGTLSNYLIRPLDYLKYNLFRDFADKMINTAFAVIEVVLFIVLLRPSFFWQSDAGILFLSVLSLIIAVFLYFLINLTLSFIGFWSKEYWAPRFVFFIVVSFLAGTYFPLDIVPSGIYTVIQYLPFTYLVFFPLNIYLGRADLPLIIKGFTVSVLWLFILYFIAKSVWHRGLRVYTAEGK